MSDAVLIAAIQAVFGLLTAVFAGWMALQMARLNSNVINGAKAAAKEVTKVKDTLESATTEQRTLQRSVDAKLDDVANTLERSTAITSAKLSGIASAVLGASMFQGARQQDAMARIAKEGIGDQ